MAASKEKQIKAIREDIRDISARLKKLCSDTRSSAMSKKVDTAAYIEEEIENLKENLAREAVEKGKVIDKYVEEHHWQAGIAFLAAGMLAGIMIGKKR